MIFLSFNNQPNYTVIILNCLVTGIEILRSFAWKMVLLGDSSNILAPVLATKHCHRNIYGESK